MKYFILAGFSFLLVSCGSSVHQVHVSDFELVKGKKIEAHAQRKEILYGSETNYVNEAYQRLQDQCKQGQIHGITTRYFTDLGFFSWTNYIVMQGTLRSINLFKLSL